VHYGEISEKNKVPVLWLFFHNTKLLTDKKMPKFLGTLITQFLQK